MYFLYLFYYRHLHGQQSKNFIVLRTCFYDKHAIHFECWVSKHTHWSQRCTVGVVNPWPPSNRKSALSQVYITKLSFNDVKYSSPSMQKCCTFLLLLVKLVFLSVIMTSTTGSERNRNNEVTWVREDTRLPLLICFCYFTSSCIHMISFMFIFFSSIQ